MEHIFTHSGNFSLNTDFGIPVFPIGQFLLKYEALLTIETKKKDSQFVDMKVVSVGHNPLVLHRNNKRKDTNQCILSPCCIIVFITLPNLNTIYLILWELHVLTTSFLQTEISNIKRKYRLKIQCIDTQDSGLCTCTVYVYLNEKLFYFLSY